MDTGRSLGLAKIDPVYPAQIAIRSARWVRPETRGSPEYRASPGSMHRSNSHRSAWKTGSLHAGTTDIDQQRTLILSLDPPSATTCKPRLVPNRGSPSMMAAEPPVLVANWANDQSILAHGLGSSGRRKLQRRLKRGGLTLV